MFQTEWGINTKYWHYFHSTGPGTGNGNIAENYGLFMDIIKLVTASQTEYFDLI